MIAPISQTYQGWPDLAAGSGVAVVAGARGRSGWNATALDTGGIGAAGAGATASAGTTGSARPTRAAAAGRGGGGAPPPRWAPAGGGEFAQKAAAPLPGPPLG